MSAAPIRVFVIAPSKSDDEAIDRLLHAWGKHAMMPMRLQMGMATDDEARLRKAEYEEARAAVLGRMSHHPASTPPAGEPR